MIQKNPFSIKGQNHSEEDFKRAIANKELLEAEFNVGPACNLDCSFCYTGSNSNPKTNRASLEEIDTFLSQVSEAGAKTVRIVGVGEPFLDKRIFDGQNFPFFELAEKHGITTVVYTNGTKITRDLARRLIDRDVSLVTKLYSFNPIVFEEMTGNKGYFSQDKQIRLVGDKFIPRNLAELMDLGFNKGNPTRLGINNVITSQNITELEDMYLFARFNNISIRFSASLEGLRSLDEKSVTDLDKLLERYNKLAEWEERFSSYSWQPYGEIVGGQCSRLGFNITLDGINYKICAGSKSDLVDEKGNPLTIRNSNVCEVVKTHPLFEKMRLARKNNHQFRCVMSQDIYP